MKALKKAAIGAAALASTFGMAAPAYTADAPKTANPVTSSQPGFFKASAPGATGLPVRITYGPNVSKGAVEGLVERLSRKCPTTAEPHKSSPAALFVYVGGKLATVETDITTAEVIAQGECTGPKPTAAP